VITSLFEFRDRGLRTGGLEGWVLDHVGEIMAHPNQNADGVQPARSNIDQIQVHRTGPLGFST
jgi:hypothetical protein